MAESETKAPAAAATPPSPPPTKPPAPKESEKPAAAAPTPPTKPPEPPATSGKTVTVNVDGVYDPKKNRRYNKGIYAAGDPFLERLADSGEYRGGAIVVTRNE